MKLEFILLGVLLQRPMTGYDLKKFMDQTGRFMRRNTAMTQVYRSLRRMADDGLVVHDTEPRPGATDAKRYRVTPEGETVFLDWLSADYNPPFGPADPDFYVHLRFRAAYLGLDAVLELIDNELARRRRQVELFRHRDRTEIVDPTTSFDEQLAGFVVAWQHWRGTQRADLHIEALVELRAALADGMPLPQLGPNPLVRAAGDGDRRFDEIADEIAEEPRR